MLHPELLRIMNAQPGEEEQPGLVNAEDQLPKAKDDELELGGPAEANDDKDVAFIGAAADKNAATQRLRNRAAVYAIKELGKHEGAIQQIHNISATNGSYVLSKKEVYGLVGNVLAENQPNSIRVHELNFLHNLSADPTVFNGDVEGRTSIPFDKADLEAIIRYSAVKPIETIDQQQGITGYKPDTGDPDPIIQYKTLITLRKLCESDTNGLNDTVRDNIKSFISENSKKYENDARNRLAELDISNAQHLAEFLDDLPPEITSMLAQQVVLKITNHDELQTLDYGQDTYYPTTKDGVKQLIGLINQVGQVSPYQRDHFIAALDIDGEAFKFLENGDRAQVRALYHGQLLLDKNATPQNMRSCLAQLNASGTDSDFNKEFRDQFTADELITLLDKFGADNSPFSKRDRERFVTKLEISKLEKPAVAGEFYRQLFSNDTRANKHDVQRFIDDPNSVRNLVNASKEAAKAEADQEVSEELIDRKVGEKLVEIVGNIDKIANDKRQDFINHLKSEWNTLSTELKASYYYKMLESDHASLDDVDAFIHEDLDVRRRVMQMAYASEMRFDAAATNLAYNSSNTSWFTRVKNGISRMVATVANLFRRNHQTDAQEKQAELLNALDVDNALTTKEAATFYTKRLYEGTGDKKSIDRVVLAQLGASKNPEIKKEFLKQFIEDDEKLDEVIRLASVDKDMRSVLLKHLLLDDTLAADNEDIIKLQAEVYIKLLSVDRKELREEDIERFRNASDDIKEKFVNLMIEKAQGPEELARVAVNINKRTGDEDKLFMNLLVQQYIAKRIDNSKTEDEVSTNSELKDRYIAARDELTNDWHKKIQNLIADVSFERKVGARNLYINRTAQQAIIAELEKQLAEAKEQLAEVKEQTESISRAVTPEIPAGVATPKAERPVQVVSTDSTPPIAPFNRSQQKPELDQPELDQPELDQPELDPQGP